MKIHTKIVIDLASGEMLEDEHYEYDGPVVEAGGGPSGGGQPEHTTQTQEPWDEQKPFLTKGFERAETDVFNRPLEFFPGATVVPYSPETEFAFGAQTSRAMGGSPLLRGAQNEIGRLLSGSYLPGMPFQSPQWATPSLMSQATPTQVGGGKGPPQAGAPSFPSPFQPGQIPGQTPAPAPGAPNLPPPATNPVAPPPEPGTEPAPTPPQELVEGSFIEGPHDRAGFDSLPPAPSGLEWTPVRNGHRLIAITEDDDGNGD